MSNAAPGAATAGNKFREVARSTDNPTTKLLAEGLTALTEAIRELDDKLEKVERQVRSGVTWMRAQHDPLNNHCTALEGRATVRISSSRGRSFLESGALFACGVGSHTVVNLHAVEDHANQTTFEASKRCHSGVARFLAFEVVGAAGSALSDLDQCDAM